MNKIKIEELEKKRNKITKEINDIQEAEISEIQIPLLKKMVGKCFIYRDNCYSTPKKKSDYWNVFKKIVAYHESEAQGFHFIIEEFQIDREGKVSLFVYANAPFLNKAWWNKPPFNGYEEISENEYNEAKHEMDKEILFYSKIIKALNKKYSY